MQEYYNQDPRGLIMAPDDRLGDQIALTAWTNIAKGKTFDEEVFDTFVDEFGFRGPESCKTTSSRAASAARTSSPATSSAYPWPAGVAKLAIRG